MSDASIPSSADLKQSRTVGKSSGAKDAKALKHNPNRDLQAPDIPDIDKENAIAERLGRRGHAAHQPAVVKRVLKYAEMGYSPTQISKFKRMPHYTTIYTWMREDPDFSEEFKTRYRSYVDDQARQLLPLASQWGEQTDTLEDMLNQAKNLSSTEGLKPFERVQAVDRAIQRTVEVSTALVNAQDKRVHRTLQIAARQLPQDWGEHADPEIGTIVLDVSLGPIKEFNPPGSLDGQNVKALESGRWGQKALPSPKEVGGV